MHLTLIFDTNIDLPNDALKEVLANVNGSRNHSPGVITALEKILKLDLEEDVDIFENDYFVLVKEPGRERLFTKG